MGLTYGAKVQDGADEVRVLRIAGSIHGEHTDNMVIVSWATVDSL